MNKLLSKIIAAVACCGIALGSGKAVSASYSGDNEPVDYNGAYYLESMYPNGNAPDFSESAIKPTISVEQKIIKYNDSVPGSTQKVEISISGADKAYVATSIHILFDNRLIVANPYKPLERGNAISSDKIDYKSQLNYRYESDNIKGELWAYTVGDDNYGKDGVMYTAEFIIPDDAKEGDVYPIGIEFEADEYTSDMFTNVTNNYAGRLMQGWIFTKGIENGYIKLESPDYQPPTEDTQPRIIPDGVKMTVGSTSQLLLMNAPPGEEVMWTSDNLGVVTVDNGLVTAVGTGKATVYAICGNNLMMSYITVGPSDAIRGDANCDSDVNMSDVVIVMQSNLNPTKYGLNGTSVDKITVLGESNGDVDGSKGLSLNDALTIQKYTLKMVDIL